MVLSIKLANGVSKRKIIGCLPIVCYLTPWEPFVLMDSSGASKLFDVFDLICYLISLSYAVVMKRSV